MKQGKTGLKFQTCYETLISSGLKSLSLQILKMATNFQLLSTSASSGTSSSDGGETTQGAEISFDPLNLFYHYHAYIKKIIVAA